MTTIKKFLTAVARLFTRPETRAALVALADYVPAALPYILIGAKIIARETPTGIDDYALAYIQREYPELFDGSIRDAEQLKLFVFSAVSDAFAKFTKLSTTQARAVIQIAFTARKLEAA